MLPRRIVRLAGLRLAGLAPALALIAWASGCAHSKIPQTQIDDTPENRAIIETIGSYQRAFENRDAEAIVAMISTRYFEDNGNTDPSDDYDLAGLKAALVKEFGKTKRAQLELRVNEVVVEDEKAHATIYYTYRAQSEFPVGLKWKSNSDLARINFEFADGKWLIVSGL